MPQPTQSDVHVNAPLTNISVAWLLDQNDFVATKVFPMVPVDNASDLYYEFDKGDFLRDEAQVRGESAESAGSGFRLSTTSYNCKVEAFHKDIDDRVRANADSVLSLDSAATAYVSQKLAIRRENRFATNFFTTGIWGTDHTPSILWDLPATAVPRSDVDTAKSTIKSNTGYAPNTMVVSYPVFLKLRAVADIRDQFKYTSADSIDEAMMARYFGIDNFYVAGGVYNTAKEGASFTGSMIFGKHCLVCYVPPAAGLLTPAAGYTFAWRGYIGSVDGQRISKMRIEPKKSDRIEGELAYDFKVVASALGYFMGSVIS